MLTPIPKQEILLKAVDFTTILYGGARGGAKTLGTSGFKASMEIVEWYSEAEVKKKNIDVSKYRNTGNSYEKTYYYKYLIDYPEYQCCIVRKTEPSLLSNTKVECDKVFPELGGRWLASQKKYVFPSGAEVWLRPAGNIEQLDFFQGQNFHRLIIEELTQFDEDVIEEIEFCCRSTHKYIKAMQIYTTNPGKRGHKWVKNKYIDKCKPLRDGYPIYLEEFDLTYQPLKPGKPYITKTGERFFFIPSLVFDNTHLADKDKAYIRKLMGKSELLKQMWLFGNWDVFVGQFFSMWDESVHVRDEIAFFGAKDDIDLIAKKRNFDWSNYRLFTSNDYGFAEKAAWACGAYAIHNETNDIVKFAEIVKPGLTIKQQARYTKEFFARYYNLTLDYRIGDDFEMHIADPISYWQRKDKGDEFWTFALAYQEEGIFLTKGLNSREDGAMAMAEALIVRSDGTARLTFLNNCEEAIASIPNLPADKRNPNDVDTTVFDHPYDENRYFLMVLIGNAFNENKKEKKRDWRDNIPNGNILGTYEGRPRQPQSWIAA